MSSDDGKSLSLMTKRIHIVIADRLLKEIDALAGKRGRSTFLREAAWKEVRRLRMKKALESAIGSWNDEDHPELKCGAARYIKKLRKQSERRLAVVGNR